MAWGRSEEADPKLPPLAYGHFAADMRSADQARDRGDWQVAADAYRAALSERPGEERVWRQLGNVLKDAGDPVAACAAYREALLLDPDDAETHLQLGHAAKLANRRAEAIGAYGEAARLDPNLRSARDELIALGARNALPKGDFAANERWRQLVAVARVMAEGEGAMRRWIGSAAYPPAAWDQFRRDLPIRPPPGGRVAPLQDLRVLVDARTCEPFRLRATLRSLQDQSVEAWQAVVICDDAMRAHPVASFADTDPRISFPSSPADLEGGSIMVLDGGTILEREATAWFCFALRRTGAAAVFADHETGIADRDLGIVRDEPMLFGAYDPLYMARVGPPLVVAAREAGRLPMAAPASEWRRSLCEGANATARIAHLPRVLSTRLTMPLIAGGEPGRPQPGAHPRLPFAADADDTRIAVIIPTRDAPALLNRAMQSLRATADRPDRVEIIVVDNDSQATETKAALDELRESRKARVVAFDSPFNWSRASNLGAIASDAPILLFANDDIEMTTSGWDSLLVAHLRAPDVGVVGARLLYPDRTVQHAGMVCGLGPGGVEHEGRHLPATDPGPGARLVSSRSVAGVTGAFLGIARETFEQVGRFDEARLMVSYSDVDLCFKVRETGLLVRYVAEIEAIHHEGATRGRNLTAEQVAFDEGERADFVDRWGSAIDRDVGASPYWAVGGIPFDGLRDPSIHDVLDHLDQSAQAQPWKPRRREADETRIWGSRLGEVP